MDGGSESSLAVLQTANDRLAVWQDRQAKKHKLFQQMSIICSDQLLSASRLGFAMHASQQDEAVYRKQIILPVISRLKAPVLGRRLRKKIKRLLAKVSTTTNADFLVSRSVDGIKNGPEASNSLTTGENGKLAAPSDAQTASTDGNEMETLRGDHMTRTYTGSATFLKGTQSANPHNDYCQHFVDTGERPQNFIRDTGLRNRFEEYPKLRELIRLKDDLIRSRAPPPMYLQTDLKSFDLTDLQSKFDVVLIEPPLEEYHRMNGAVFDQHWTWDEIERLEIERIISPRSFVWIWCGSGEGLDAARRCLRKWGFRRCEDICWIKTNHGRPGHEALEPGAVFQRSKEHCLMGIHGTVRRSTDGDFIHANIDIDLIIEDAPKYGGYEAKDKPTEIFHIIEHFCLGRRRLHLFGRDSTLRPGWLTVGNELSASNFDARHYTSNFTKEPNSWMLGSTDEIERMRPKSPPPRHTGGGGGGGQSTVGTSAASGSMLSSSSTPSTSITASLPHGINSNMSMGGGNMSKFTGVAQSSIGSRGMHFTGLGGMQGKPGMMGHSGRRSGPGNSSKHHNLASLQPSLLGLPSPMSPFNDMLSGFSRNTGHARDRSAINTNNLISVTASAAAAGIGQASITPNIQFLAPLWTPPPSSLAAVAAMAAAANASKSLASVANSALRNPVYSSSLLSQLLAAGKLNPAVLTALGAANPAAVGLPSPFFDPLRGFTQPPGPKGHGGGPWH